MHKGWWADFPATKLPTCPSNQRNPETNLWSSSVDIDGTTWADANVGSSSWKWRKDEENQHEGITWPSTWEDVSNRCQIHGIILFSAWASCWQPSRKLLWRNICGIIYQEAFASRMWDHGPVVQNKGRPLQEGRVFYQNTTLQLVKHRVVRVYWHPWPDAHGASTKLYKPRSTTPKWNHSRVSGQFGGTPQHHGWMLSAIRLSSARGWRWNGQGLPPKPRRHGIGQSSRQGHWEGSQSGGIPRMVCPRRRFVRQTLSARMCLCDIHGGDATPWVDVAIDWNRTWCTVRGFCWYNLLPSIHQSSKFALERIHNVVLFLYVTYTQYIFIL